MKKMLKIIGIIVLVFAALVVLLFVKAAATPAVPKNYTETVETGVGASKDREQFRPSCYFTAMSVWIYRCFTSRKSSRLIRIW